MERSLEQPVVDPTYLEFFGLTQSPFAHPPQPFQLFHSEQYSLLTEHLANAATNTDSLVVIFGADGSGKSTLINRFVTSIDDQISCVVVDETCHGEEQFYTAFLTQIGFEEITGTATELRNITKEFLVCRGIANDHVLIIIDNAHLTDLRILEQIRWLCEIKIKDRRVLSVVLVGNADIVRMVDAPAMRKTRFRSQVVFGIRHYSEEETANYVWHRLRIAGADDAVKLPNDASSLIHRYSGGVPHLINRLCDDMLVEAYGLESRVITEEIVRTVADKQQLLPHVVPLHGKGRRKSDPDFKHVRVVPKTAGVDSDNLLRQIARLSEQLGDLRADKARALQDIDVRNNDIIALRDAITQQNLAISNSATALEDSENRSEKLASDLEKETRAREAAQKELASTKATVEELNQLKQELQATVDDVQADLEVANKRAAEIEALEKHTVNLNDEIEGKTGELDSLRDELKSLRDELASRNEAIADLETRLGESQAECESAQKRITALKDPEELEAIEKTSDKLASDLEKETRARAAAEKDLANTKAIVEELGQLQQELQETVLDLNADLKVADERAVEIEALEKNAAALKEEIDGKTGELDSLRDELKSLRDRLTSRDKDVADLERWLQESQKERASAQLRISTLKDPEELEAIQRTSDKLASDLEKESRARAAAEKDLAKATATVEELSQLKQELQGTVRDLKADLKVVGERAVEVHVLERNVTDLKQELEKRTRALDSRDQTLAGLEKQLEASKNECELLRRRAPAAKTGEKIVVEQALPASSRDARVHSSHVVTKFEQSISNIPAYQTLREYDPAFYDGLILTYKQLVGLDLTDKQVNDALRAKQVKLMERLLPGASDEAIIAYARLIVDQLDELRLDGTEPSLSLLIPQSSPDNTSPAYSEITKGRELDTLDVTLRTYDADRQLPAEKDVWPDLGPIFEELFDEFGADNVAAMENSYDPGVDRGLVCNVTRALYSGILKLSESNAANALRWLLST